MDESHKDRMKEIGKVAIPFASGSPEFETYARLLKRRYDANPLLQQELKKRWHTAQTRVEAFSKNGAGLDADKTVREFFLGFNHRIWAAGLDNLPISFNVLEAFVQYDPALNCLDLLPEIDHIFSFEDFLDFATSVDSPADPYTGVELLTEGKIYNFSSNDDLNRCTLSATDGSEYALASFSMVRRGSELSILTLAGEIADLEEIERKFADAELSELRPELSTLLPANYAESRLRPERLRQTENMWRTVAFARFDFKRKAVDVRYIHRDLGLYYECFSDDPDLAESYRSAGHTEDEIERKLQQNIEMIDSKSALFDILKTGILLPAYFQFKITLVREETCKTEFHKIIKGLRYSRKGTALLRNSLSSEERIIYRRISALRIVGNRQSTPIGRTYTPPDFRVEVSGFWRRLTGEDTLGRDPEGKSISGKTWVRSHIRWRDRPLKDQKIVFIKSRISAAKRIADFEQQNDLTITTSDSPLPLAPEEGAVQLSTIGYVYILTNPSLGTDIFKVGRTTKDPRERAKEISAGTGVPTPFLVAEQWHVNDVVAAERAAHAALDQFRINTAREFFNVAFRIARKTIENAISSFLEM